MKHFHDPNAALKHVPLSKGQRAMAVIIITTLIAWIVCGLVLK